MAGDTHNQRFFSDLSMLTFFMLVLVAGDNYLIMFLGGEGIGVSSYLLINLGYTRLQANKSAINDMMIGLGSNFWANSPFVLPKNEILAESEFAAPTITKLIPILFSTSGASLAYNVNLVADQFQRAFQTSTFCNRLYSFFNKRWFFDQVLNDFLVRSFLRFGYSVSFEALDKGAIEILGPYGISYTFRRLAERISQLQSGSDYHYAFAMLLGSTPFVTFSRMWDSLIFLGRFYIVFHFVSEYFYY
nr:Nad5 [Zea mays]